MRLNEAIGKIRDSISLDADAYEIKLIKRRFQGISKSIPVIIVTHNSTVGASIKPNYIACTKREIENGKIIYKTFSGHPADIHLKSVTGEIINNYDAMLNCLEAGNDEYNKRREETYDILKN